MAKTKFTLSDYEIMKKREEGETIASIAEEADVSYGIMQRKLQNLPVKKPKIQLYDTLGDGKGGIYTVIEIGDKCFTIKNNATLKTDKISKRLFNAGETTYHKLNTPPVTVYNLNDQKREEPEAPKGPGTSEEAEDTLYEWAKAYERSKTRSYLLQIDRILTAAKGIDEDAEPDLYDLIQQLLRSGFDKEFGGKR